MEWDGKKCLIVSDYFSEYFLLLHLNVITTIALISHFPELFAKKGTSQKVFTDNSQPFNFHKLQHFVK